MSLLITLIFSIYAHADNIIQSPIHLKKKANPNDEFVFFNFEEKRLSAAERKKPFRSLSKLELSTALFATSLSGVSKANNSTGALAGLLNEELTLSWYLLWSKNFQTSLFLGTKYLTFSAPSKKLLLNNKKLYQKYGLTSQWQIFDYLKFGVNLSAIQKPILGAYTGNDLVLFKTYFYSIEFEPQIRWAQYKLFEFYFSLIPKYSATVAKKEFHISSGFTEYEYKLLAVENAQPITFNSSVFFRRFKTENRDITETYIELGIGAGLSFSF